MPPTYITKLTHCLSSHSLIFLHTAASTALPSSNSPFATDGKSPVAGTILCLCQIEKVEPLWFEYRRASYNQGIALLNGDTELNLIGRPRGIILGFLHVLRDLVETIRSDSNDTQSGDTVKFSALNRVSPTPACRLTRLSLRLRD
ncbi:unnamed protein product [Linum trigynum]|uniref:Uncharacterized protein n=1 Tax=Linum trigynum TaxID=586398 RepID=A0AAV2G5H3_9ROSI